MVSKTLLITLLKAACLEIMVSKTLLITLLKVACLEIMVSKMLLITLLKAACLEVMVSEMLLDYTVYIYTCMVRVMLCNATFNNISVIPWQSVLLVEETGVPLYHMMLYLVHLA